MRIQIGDSQHCCPEKCFHDQCSYPGSGSAILNLIQIRLLNILSKFLKTNFRKNNYIFYYIVPVPVFL
jgi:hypothetical protein